MKDKKLSDFTWGDLNWIAGKILVGSLAVLLLLAGGLALLLGRYVLGALLLIGGAVLLTKTFRKADP